MLFTLYLQINHSCTHTIYRAIHFVSCHSTLLDTPVMHLAPAYPNPKPSTTLLALPKLTPKENIRNMIMYRIHQPAQNRTRHQAYFIQRPPYPYFCRIHANLRLEGDAGRGAREVLRFGQMWHCSIRLVGDRYNANRDVLVTRRGTVQPPLNQMRFENESSCLTTPHLLPSWFRWWGCSRRSLLVLGGRP